jgi:gamma-glutamyl hercynylcysteine S-oxide hydrolase
VWQGDEGVLVASEPLDDDPHWVDVPDAHLVEVSGGDVTITALES